MSAQILDGKKLAIELKEKLKAEVEALKQEFGKGPKLVNILIGDDDGSCAYANSQRNTANQVGIEYELKTLPNKTSQEEFCALLEQLNEDSAVNGIMVHKPVPEHIDYKKASKFISTIKDLEGINIENIGRMSLGETRILPCTPASVMEHLKSTGVELRGKEVAIVGASDIVGKPLALLLLREYATVHMCHVATSEAGKLVEHINNADIVVVAVGKAGLIKGEWIKEGAIVIDVGINRVEGKIVGDVEFETAKDRASFITPVPGGVGPVTVVMLMRNGIEAFKIQNNILEKSNSGK